MKATLRGVTLIELLVTISLVVVLASIAAPSFRSFMINQQLSTAASDLLSSLLQARSEAVRLGKPVMVVAAQEVGGPTASSYSWLDGWCVFVDEDRNATYNSATSTLINCTKKTDLQGMVAVVAGTGKTSGPFAQGKPFFMFSPAGFAAVNSARYSGTPNGCLWMEASATGRKRAVVVGLSGRARIYDPGTATTCSTN